MIFEMKFQKPESNFVGFKENSEMKFFFLISFYIYIII